MFYERTTKANATNTHNTTDIKNYHIKECLIFGSMLKGNNNLFSDFDIAVEATNIMKIVEKNKDYLVSEGTILKTLQELS